MDGPVGSDGPDASLCTCPAAVDRISAQHRLTGKGLAVCLNYPSKELLPNGSMHADMICFGLKVLSVE